MVISFEHHMGFQCQNSASKKTHKDTHLMYFSGGMSMYVVHT